MNRPIDASRCRQRILEGLTHLSRLARVLQGRETMLRASRYRCRRRCGTSGCRCERGAWHQGRALSVSVGGRSRTISLAGLDCVQLHREVETYRQWRQARAEMVRVFAEIVQAVDQLGQVRTISAERLRQSREGSEGATGGRNGRPRGRRGRTRLLPR